MQYYILLLAHFMVHVSYTWFKWRDQPHVHHLNHLQTPFPPNRQCLFLPLFSEWIRRSPETERLGVKRRSSIPAMPSSTPSTNGIMPEAKKAGKGCPHCLTFINVLSSEQVHLSARTLLSISASFKLTTVICYKCTIGCCLIFLIIWYSISK